MVKRSSRRLPAAERNHTAAREWLFSSRVDPWLMYRLSMLMMVVLLCLAWSGALPEVSHQTINSFSIIALLQALINWPHFMVSYKVLYLDHRDWKKYSAAMIHLPLGLLGLWLMATYWVWTERPVIANNFAYLVWVLAAFYLAWHYVGQSWGVVSLGLMQSGFVISQMERTVFLVALKILIGWHVVWAMQQVGAVPVLSQLKSQTAMTLANVLAVGSALVSGAVLVRIFQRHRRLPEKVWAPLVLLYLWYLVLWVQPLFALFIQLSHALQYLIFPAKIQIARAALDQQRIHSEGNSLRSAWIKLLLTYIACALTGWLVFMAPEIWFKDHSSAVVLAGLLASLINIHHYFTDGAIWKLKDARVRGLLLTPLNCGDAPKQAKD